MNSRKIIKSPSIVPVAYIEPEEITNFEIETNDIALAEELLKIVNDDNKQWILDPDIVVHVQSWLILNKYNPEDVFRSIFNQKHRPEFAILLGFIYRWSIGMVTRDLSKSFQWYKVAAEAGSALAMTEVGVCYFNGDGVTIDRRKALEYYQKSAELGNAFGQYNLSFCLEHGIGTEADKEKAVNLLKISAMAGNAFAQHRLAVAYFGGISIPVDEYLGFYWFLESAQRKYSLSYFQVGFSYNKGHGIVRDFHKAIKWFRRSHQAGQTCGSFSLQKIFLAR
ncbi:hypothetical protein G9A89_003491 [Geosiphon pyriformis]|nr:hypothetical protein G9A89_003491 [Geosiphon pyriformis]